MHDNLSLAYQNPHAMMFACGDFNSTRKPNRSAMLLQAAIGRPTSSKKQVLIDICAIIFGISIIFWKFLSAYLYWLIKVDPENRSKQKQE